MYKYTLVLVIFLASCSASVVVKESAPERVVVVRETPAPPPVPNTMGPVLPAKAKNVILLIGDGTGIPQISAGMYSNGRRLAGIERFKVIGLHKNHSSDNLITDSAAGATAFSCGVKSFNGAIGVSADSSAVETILEEAEERGLATGLVATCEITHATPASFIAHVDDRGNHEGIAEDFLETEIDYFVGGGQKYFNRRKTDDRDLKQMLADRGYYMSDYFNEPIDSIDFDAHSKVGYFTSDDKPLPVLQGRDYLESASLKGIDFLDNQSDEGFFMMIEASQIDWGGHANNLDYVVSEMLEFDRIIDKVLDWAEADGETLVIVTADHECGGLTFTYGSTDEDLKENFSSTGHTLTLIPVFAYGPGAEEFSGIYDNTKIYNKMRHAFGWDMDNK